jgi:ligand-binding sensor domain-containing protein/signal transduction histidine kinase
MRKLCGATRIQLTAAVLFSLALSGAAEDAPTAPAVEAPKSPLSQYTSRAWQTDEGLPHNLVRAITQTPDGYLWVGTRLGLARFDGIRFTCFDSKNTPALRNHNVSALAVGLDGSLWVGTYGGGLVHLKDGVFSRLTYTNGLVGNELSCLYPSRDGSLWIGTTKGVSHYKSETFQNYTTNQGLTFNIVRAISEDGDGNIWVATGEGLNRIKNGVIENLTPASGVPYNSMRALHLDKSNRLWIGWNNGLLCYDQGKFISYPFEKELSGSFVTAVREDVQGIIWAGTYSGLKRFRDGQFFNVPNSDGSPFDLINVLFEDRESNIWVGSREGLARLTPRQLFTYTRQQGLTHNNIMSVREDRQGSLWVGTWGGGLNRLKDDKVTVYSTQNGFPHDLILATCEGRDGTLWVGTDFDGGLIKMKDGKVTRYSSRQGLINAAIRVIYEDSASSIWIGTTRGLSCLRNGKFTNYFASDIHAGNSVLAICEDRCGTLWFGTENGLAFRQNGEFRHFAGSGLGSSAVLSLYEDSAHDFWIGTEGDGLFRLRDGDLSHYTTKEGLFSNDMFETIEDDLGYFWMSCLKGIWRVSKKELDALDQKQIETVHSVFYGRLDGLLSVQCNGVSKPSGFKSHDGRIWFPTTKGLVLVDPRIKLNDNDPSRPEPSVVIEQVITGNGTLDLALKPPAADSALRIPRGRGDLEIHYTALSLQIPEKNHFRYMLEGADPDWINADTRRVAYYNHLRPGGYRFHVIASNKDGLWNEAGATLALELAPAFWETVWFRSLAVLGLAGALAGSVRYVSVRRLRHKLAALEQQHAIEKERARIAKDIHDDLGASLTQITLLSDRGDSAAPEELRSNVCKISSTAREIAQSLDEIVWAVNPQHDSLEGLIEYISQSADDFLEDTSIRSRVKLPPALPHCSIPAETRHQFFLAFREALNNAVKHAEASEIQLEVLAEPAEFRIKIADNGIGFDPKKAQVRGNGLTNMRKRLEGIGGRFAITSSPGHGTTVNLTISLNHNGS